MKTFILSSLYISLLFLSPLSAMCSEEGTELKLIYNKTNQKTTSTTCSPEEIANDLDKAINYELFSKKSFSSQEALTANTIVEFCSMTNLGASLILSDNAMDTILHVINNPSNVQSLTLEVIAALHRTNAPFNTFVSRYTDIAYQDIENVTSSTLSQLENPSLNQPSKKLNILPLALKQYIMKNALKRIKRSYSMTIDNSHDHCEIVSDAADLATTIANGTNTVFLWDLKKGKFVANLEPSGDEVKDVVFNKDGTRLAIASSTYSKKNKSYTSYVNEWDTQSYTRCFSVKQICDTPISSITYIDNNAPQRTFLVLFDTHDNPSEKPMPVQCIWSIDSDNKPLYTGEIHINSIQQRPLKYEKEDTSQKYSVFHNYLFSPGTKITKHNCSSLYLCEQATKNAHSKTEFSTIEQSQTYATLTEIEKDMIEKQMQEKKATLRQLKQRQSQDTRPLLTNNTITRTQSHTNKGNTVTTRSLL